MCARAGVAVSVEKGVGDRFRRSGEKKKKKEENGIIRETVFLFI